ncbi:MAG: SpoIIE family protein phosphatase, partial [Candidatus Riflebacteria bacterium]
ENPIEIKDIALVKSNLNIIRQFLGRVFLPETLRYPYQSEGRSDLILADYGRERPYFWYQVGEKFSVLVFLNWDLIKGNYGLTRLCQAANQRYPQQFCGFSHISDLARVFPDPPRHLKDEILTGLARFENVGELNIEQRTTLMSVHQLNSKIRIFNISLKNSRDFAVVDRKNQIMLQAVTLYLFGFLLAYFNFRVRKAFFSIRLKLLLLFLYANLAPISVLCFIAYDYLQHQKIAYRNQVSMASERLLRDFDARFERQKADYSRRLRQKITELNRRGSIELSDEKVQEIKKLTDEFKVSESFLFEDNGRTIFALSSSGKNLSSTVRYFKTIAEGVLKYMNRIIQKADKADVLSRITSPEDSDFIRNSIRDSRKIWPISIGDTIKLGYWDYLGDPANYINRYFLLFMWSEEALQSVYLQNHLNDLLKNPMGIEVFARSIKTGKMLVATAAESSEIIRLMRLIEEKGMVADNSVKIAERKCVATGIVGTQLNQISICVVFPESRIEQKVALIGKNLIGGGILSILLTSVIGLLVASQFMRPVRALGFAANEIRKHNYRHRVIDLDNDEFGHLGLVINRVSEGLADLEVAKVVQESLFPEELLVRGHFSIYGRSVVMTTLGGDYFDYFEINEANVGVIIGDVAGHGVGAALIMAMAKARVSMTTAEQRLDPSLLTKLVHEILFALKSRNLRRMMTFQYLVINTETGRVSFSNAGHCYPLLVNHEKREASYIQHIGSPLGAGRRVNYQNLEFELVPGESIVLYTDGIVEAQNHEGKQLGFPGLQKLVISSFNEDCQKFYQGIFNSYVEWSGVAGDDTTLIVINRRAE